MMLILCFTLLRTAQSHCRGAVVCAQPVPFAGDREELTEGVCPLSAATVSALRPVRTPEGEKCCMWSTGLCASWEGVSLRVVLGVFHTSAVENSAKPYISASCQHTQSCNNVGQVGGLWTDERKSNTPLLPHTKKS